MKLLLMKQRSVIPHATYVHAKHKNNNKLKPPAM